MPKSKKEKKPKKPKPVKEKAKKVKKEKKQPKLKEGKASKKATKVAAAADGPPRKPSRFNIMFKRKSSADSAPKKEQLVAPKNAKTKAGKKGSKGKKVTGRTKSTGGARASSSKKASDENDVNPTWYGRKKSQSQFKEMEPRTPPPYKEGEVERHQNKHFPGDVSYRYTSSDEVWVDFLGRKPVVNDFGNGARLILDATDV